MYGSSHSPKAIKKVVNRVVNLAVNHKVRTKALMKRMKNDCCLCYPPRYGEKHWTDVKHCQDIPQLQCDLSKEMADPKEWYYARVQASKNGVQSEWILSSRFYPQWECEWLSITLKYIQTFHGKSGKQKEQFSHEMATISKICIFLLCFRSIIQPTKVEAECDRAKHCGPHPSPTHPSKEG